MNNSEIGERIRKIREKRRMSRDELAEKAGITAKFIYDVELGKRGISAKTLIKISKVLSVSCEYIMCGTNKSRKNKQLDELIEILMQFNKAQIVQVTKIIQDIRELL